MSEPKRYQPVVQCVEPSYQAQMIEPKVMEFSEGEYVLHSDYARLKAEVERLTKAGDAMAKIIKGPAHGPGEWDGEWDNWQEAKKGGQP